MDHEIEKYIISELTSASKDIVKTIVDIWEEVIKWHSSFDDNFTLDKDARTNFSFIISKAVYDPTQIVYIARQNNKIIGFLYGYTKQHSGFFKQRTIAHVSDIAVASDYRRVGVGTALMNKFENDFAKNKNADELTLYVHSSNKEGIEFYNKLGYEVKLYSMRKETKIKEESILELNG